MGRCQKEIVKNTFASVMLASETISSKSRFMCVLVTGGMADKIEEFQRVSL
jgi:hypothetical protein